MIKSIEWQESSIRFIDQTELPSREQFVETDDVNVIADAIRTLKIRGAPLIGIAAAYGVAIASARYSGKELSTYREYLHRVINLLAATRPTAVNLFWSLQRMSRVLEAPSSLSDIKQALIVEALAIHQEDREMCRRMGEHGAALIPDPATILTHCNTGALATGGEGTALSVIATAHRQGKKISVYADETRPLFQGARLTMWELMNLGIPATLITDSTAAFLMKQKKIDLIVVGADRIASNGDAANKIGTYNLAVNAYYHHVPFYIAAPSSTIDYALRSGEEIPIEERASEEIVSLGGHRIAPEGAKIYAPAFDVTPAKLIAAIITEKGVQRPPYHFHAPIPEGGAKI